MSLSSLSVRRGVTFGMIYLVVIGFGLYSLSRLQLDLYPDITFPAVMIITTYTGASPEDVEKLITRPVEGAVSAVKGVESVKSDSKQGSSVVTVEFDWGRDMDQAETDIRRKLDLVEGLLPDDADKPLIFAMDPSMQPVVILMMSGPYPMAELRDIAEDDIVPMLERLNGVASAEVAGGLKREIHVTLDPLRVEAFGVDVNAVLGGIYSENLQEPGGSIEQGSLDFTIQAEGKFQSVEEIGEVVVGMRLTADGPKPLKLKEVAEIKDGFAESSRIIEVDRVPSVWVAARKQSGANSVKTAGNIISALPSITKAAGVDIEFKTLFNQADFINLSLGNLSTTALAGVGISFIVLLLFLRNVRSAAIVSTAIPLSVIATFFVMDQAGMTLNVISMAGLALAVGMLVDNAIVVLENIFRLRQEGLAIRKAAMQGAGEVGVAVTASTLTTVAVFVPVLFVPGIAGVMFRDLAVTICFALSVSLVVALSFIPLAASRVLGTPRAGRLLDRATSRHGFDGFRNGYGRFLDWVLRHRWVVALALLALLGMTGLLATLMPTSFMAQGDHSHLELSVETAIGNNLEQTQKEVREVEDVIASAIPDADRRMIAGNIGMAEGFGAIFSKGIHAAGFWIPLVNAGKRETSQQAYEDKLRVVLARLPGIKSKVGPRFDITGSGGDIDLEIRGHNLEIMRQVGETLKEQLMTLEEMAEIDFTYEDQKLQLNVEYDRAKMADLGLTTQAVGKAISTYFKGSIAGRYSEEGDEYDILVRYGKSHREDINELRRMPVVTPKGGVVTLANIARIERALGPVSISRKDQERMTTLICKLKDEFVAEDGTTRRKDLGSAIARVESVLERFP
jgi:hydrophobic/amphiphilic exporter-1 (mainly G- bacteria), HAE1 family